MKKLNKFLFTIFLITEIALVTSCESVEIAGERIKNEFSDFSDSINEASKSVKKAMEDFSPEEEYLLGLSVANSICKVYPVKDNKELTDYLNKICTTLTINSLYPYSYKGYHVVLVHSDDINAISTPGGHIFVTDALIRVCESEDEIAAVLAHELAHIQLKHGINVIKGKRTSVAVQNLTVVTIKATGAVLDIPEFSRIASEIDESASIMTDALLNTGFSKIQEFAADNAALQLMADAGYNPKAMRSLLEHLEKNEIEIQKAEKRSAKKIKKSTKAEKKFGSNLNDLMHSIDSEVRFTKKHLKQEITFETPSVFSTHPAPEARLENIEKDLHKYKRRHYRENARKQRFEDAILDI